MFHNEDCTFVASTDRRGVFMESSRCSAPCASDEEQRNRSRSAVNIGFFANQGAMRA